MTNIDAIALQQIMEVRVAHVDWIKFTLSPYFWDLLHDFERRVDIARRRRMMLCLVYLVKRADVA